MIRRSGKEAGKYCVGDSNRYFFMYCEYHSSGGGAFQGLGPGEPGTGRIYKGMEQAPGDGGKKNMERKKEMKRETGRRENLCRNCFGAANNDCENCTAKGIDPTESRRNNKM